MFETIIQRTRHLARKDCRGFLEIVVVIAGRGVEFQPRRSGETWNLGVCAGLLAVAARLGTYDEELALVTAALAAGKRTSGWEEFTVCVDVACTATQDVKDFGEAIDLALRSWEYLPAR